MKKIMILGGSEAQLPAILRAKELGYKTFCCDMYADAYCREYADEFEQISTLDFDKLDKAMDKYKPNGIMTLASDRPMPTLARLAEKHSLNAVSVKTATNATNKYLCREELKKHGVAIPYFHKVETYEDLINGIKEFNKYPFILKPTGNSGSRGIFKIENENQIKEAYDYSNTFNVNNLLILEEYMEGREFSVESFAIDGKVNMIAITEKLTTKAPHFVEIGHSIPAKITTLEKENIKSLINDVHNALDIQNGPTHIEVILTSEGPKVVEVAVRMGGDNISSYLVPLATGFDLVGSTIKYACGDYVEIPSIKNNSSCVRYIIPKENKVIKDVIAKDLDCYRYYIEKSKIGNVVNEDNSADRLGYVICNGLADVDETIRKTEEQIKKIEIIYD